MNVQKKVLAQLAMAFLLLISFLGCVDQDIPQKRTQDRFQIKLYSNGKLVSSWISSGTVGRTRGVFHFKDEETGKTVWVSTKAGNLIVTSAE